MKPAVREKMDRMLAADREVNRIVARNANGSVAAMAIRLMAKESDRLWLLCLAGKRFEDRRLAVGRSNAIEWLRQHRAPGTVLDHQRGPALRGPIRVGIYTLRTGPDGFLRVDGIKSELNLRDLIPPAETSKPGSAGADNHLTTEDETMSTKKSTKKGGEAATKKAPAGDVKTFAIRIPVAESEAIHAAAEAKEMSASAWARDVLAKAAARTQG